jgi:hypothetical protein
MRKRDHNSFTGENYILAKGEGNGSPDRGRKPGVARRSDNIYLDVITSLMEKNRKRVSRYYCANMKCPNTFWNADLGYTCPKCGTIGVISEFRAELKNEPEEPVLGYLDSIGRIFCRACAERFRLGDDISLIIYSNSEPYSNESCEVCRSKLSPAS